MLSGPTTAVVLGESHRLRPSAATGVVRLEWEWHGISLYDKLSNLCNVEYRAEKSGCEHKRMCCGQDMVAPVILRVSSIPNSEVKTLVETRWLGWGQKTRPSC